MVFNIAIDGTSGVGKSSIAKLLAQHYNMTHLDTGAMYRCIAYFFQQNPSKTIDNLDEIKILFKSNLVYLNSLDVTTAIRSNEISMLASDYAKNPKIRAFLVAKQQALAQNKGYILDGRDIGSVVLPDAEIKIFLSADSKVRALRRLKEYQDKGITADFTTIYEDIVKRDKQDQERTYSPLIKVDDAFEVETSDKNINEVLEIIIEYIERKVKV